MKVLWAPAEYSLSSVGGREEPRATSFSGKGAKNKPHDLTTSFILLIFHHLWGSPLPTPMCPYSLRSLLPPRSLSCS